MKQYIIILFILFFASEIFAQVTIKLGSVEGVEPGTNIEIPVIVTGLSETGSSFIGIQFKFAFQSNVLTYDEILEGNPLLPVGEWIAGSSGDKAAANWFDPGFEPTYVDDNSVLLIFVMYYGGGQTDLTFVEAETEIYADGNGNLVPISSFIGGVVTQAQGSESSIWNGEGVWSTAVNWSNGIPGDSTNAVIHSGFTEVASGAVCRNLSINADAQLVIQPGKSLSVNGNFSNDGEILIESDTLIQGSLIISGSITQSGDSKMELSVYQGIEYTISSPVVGEKAEIFGGTGNINYFSESSNTLGSMASSDEMEQGMGYAFESSTDAVITFEGLYNTQEFNVDLGFTNQGNELMQGWNLLGNPYTCSIDFDDYVTTENTDRAIYIWENNRFLVWNGTAGSIPNGIIPPLTGFFVKANSPNGKVTFKKEAKLHDFSHFESVYNPPQSVLKLNLWDFDTDRLLDETFVQIDANATTGYDGNYDALKLDYMWDYPQIFINDDDNNKLAIAAIPVADEVKLGVKLLVDGAYTIKRASVDFIPDRNIYLIDKELEITKNLREENYTFLADAGVYPDRFLVVMSGLGNDEFIDDSGLFIYSKQGEVWLHSAEDLGDCRIGVYDLSGRRIGFSEEILQAGSLVSIRGVSGINIISVETSKMVYRYKIFVR
jgi:hypothetical protein